MIRIGSRASPLAMAQSEHLQQALAAIGEESRVITRSSLADDNPHIPVRQLADGGKGIFTKQLDEALINHEIECAAHSLKDVPFDPPKNLVLACCLSREDAHDVLVTRRVYDSLASLPHGAIIGTSSPRRVSFLRHHAPHITARDIRGNVMTRVNQLRAHDYDGIILAAAGLKRLGITLADDIHAIALVHSVMLPAACQAIIGVLCRRDDNDTIHVLSRLNHMPSYLAAMSERAVLRALNADCQTAIAVHASWLTPTRLEMTLWQKIAVTQQATVTTPAHCDELAAQLVQQWRARL